MAKRTGKTSTSSSASESNTGLIVTLVIFVVMTLALGMFTFFGYDGQKDLADKAKEARNKLAEKEKELDKERAQRLVLAIAAGQETTGDLDNLKRLATSQADAIKKTKESHKELKWDAALERPTKHYVDLVADLRKERENAIGEKTNAENALKTAQNEFAARAQADAAKFAKASEDLKAAQETALAQLKKAADDYAARLDRIENELSKGKADEQQGRHEDRVAAEAEKKTLTARVKSLHEQMDLLRIRIEPANSLEADTPKGEIVRVDREAKIAYINLGSADFLKPGVTFSVMPAAATGKVAANRDVKGTLEVTQILEQHLSVARIVKIANEFRDPLLNGDFLFNPSWNSSQRDHIALSGIFDIDGDGRDDTPEIIRGLEKQGIIVDAWLDLRDRTIKGPGITERTSYLVGGERPELSESMRRQAATMGDNPIIQAFTQISGKIGDMEEKAKEKGVQKVNYRRYLSLIGYPLPKLTRPFDPTAVSYLRQSAQSAPAAEPVKDADKKE